MIFPITRTRSRNTGQAAECSAARRNAFRRSPENLPDLLRHRIETFRVAQAFSGVGEEITGTLAGRVQLRHRLVEVHANSADEPGGANQFAREQAAHLQFLVLIADMAQAKRLIERHLPTALEAIAADERFQFLLAARLWTERLLGQDVRTLKVHLPQGLPAADAEGYSNVAALGEWFTIRARDIARRFDARNRTECFQQQLDELPELLRLAVD